MFLCSSHGMPREGSLADMNKPKVLHIVTHIVGGGAEKNTIDTVKGLHKMGYDVSIMSGPCVDRGFLSSMMLSPMVRMIIIPELVRKIHPLKDYLAYRRIFKMLKEEKYGIVHTHMAKAGVLGRLAAKKAGVPLIVYGLHGMLFPDTENIVKRWAFRNIERCCGKITDVFVPVGDDLKQKYISAGIGEPQNYHVINTGMDIEKFQTASMNSIMKKRQLKKEMGLNETDLIVGMVTRFDKNKGIEYFINVAVQVLSVTSGVKFVLIGGGRYLERLKQQVQRLGLSEWVIFTGYRSDVADLISVFDIAVLTSLREGVSQFLVQAALMAKPIVTFDVDGAREIVKDGENGYIVAMKDVNLLSERIARLVDDDVLRTNLSRGSCNNVNRARTVQNMVDSTDALYQKYWK